MMKKIALIVSIFLPTAAFAHGKWLVEQYQDVIAQQHGTLQWYSWNSPEVVMWYIACVVVVLVAGFLHERLPDWRALTMFAHAYRGAIDKAAQAVLGTFLIATALFWNVVILPTEVVGTSLLVTLQWVQIVIGFMLLLHIYTRGAALALLALSALVTVANGLEAVLENIILFTLAGYFYLVHSPTHGIWALLKRYSIDMVRIGTGVSLIVLAFTEKLLYPELGMAFLAEHHWNFMQPLFPWFTNELFVLSTGFAEMLFGIVFIMGYITRINTIVIALFFLASVTTMYYQASIWEVEDFVVYCSAVLLFFFSHGHTTVPDMVRKFLKK